MARASIHTFAVDGGWANQRSRSGMVRNVYKTRVEATHAGVDIAKRDRTEHVVHASDGKIMTRDTFA